MEMKYFAPLKSAFEKLSIVAVELVGAFNLTAKAWTVDDPEVELALTLTIPEDIVADISNMSVLLELTFGPCCTKTFVPSVTTTASHMKFSVEPF